MSEGQIMEKLRSVVSSEDPKVLYSKIKKIGQGCVIVFITFFLLTKSLSEKKTSAQYLNYFCPFIIIKC